MVFGQRIKEERIKRHLTQKQLGEILGVSGTMVMYYEHGQKFPTVEQLIIISEKLQKDPNYLLGQEYLAKTATEAYTIRLSKSDLQIVSELKKHPDLYRKLIDEPKRTVELIARKINK